MDTGLACGPNLGLARSTNAGVCSSGDKGRRAGIAMAPIEIRAGLALVVARCTCKPVGLHEEPGIALAGVISRVYGCVGVALGAVVHVSASAGLAIRITGQAVGTHYRES